VGAVAGATAFAGIAWAGWIDANEGVEPVKGLVWVAAVLAAIAAALRPGGHLLFDLNTPETIEGFPDHHRVTPLSNGGLSAERGSVDPRTGAGTVVRDWFLPLEGAPGRFRRFRESYREIAWPRGAVLSALRAAGLSVRLFADASGWLSFQPEGTRWIVLARKRRAT
jgi:SAM-dependent methyltransferase